MQKFVKATIFVLAIVAGSIWVSNGIVWVGKQAKLPTSRSTPIEQTTPAEIVPQAGN